jgi:hypothetical protein
MISYHRIQNRVHQVKIAITRLKLFSRGLSRPIEGDDGKNEVKTIEP